jgi:L-alanine-DL-glutamate epimerase-like enolase superfamily enzyme
MKIARVECWKERIALTRPYSIAHRSLDAVDLFFVHLETDDGTSGYGSASPAPDITGESPEACGRALSAEGLHGLVGRDVRAIVPRLDEAERLLSGLPAALAALDMALHDLYCRTLDLALVDFLGRVHEALPTSITIGIKDVEETLAEAGEYLGRGFRHLKVKLGGELDEDLERLRKLRERHGAEVAIRVDANESYDVGRARRLLNETAALGLELVEQPLPRGQEAELAELSSEHRRLIALDESIHGPVDASQHSQLGAGVFVVKLMKCGGIRPACGIADIAAAEGTQLMWGCMDESVLSLAAALHLAYASPATRYLDLDGAFDLERDPFSGGFEVREGTLHLTGAKGLGVSPKPPS